jgi:sulfur transfer protein SufE
MIIGAIVVILLSAAVISSDMVYAHNTNNPQPEPQRQSTVQEVYQSNKVKIFDSQSIMTIDADDWLEKYSSDIWDTKTQTKMKNNWKGNYIKITGTINKIHTDFIDGTYFSIKQSHDGDVTKGWVTIVCHIFNDTDKEKIFEYKSGDEITVIGYSKWITGPELIDCYIR